MFMRKRKKSYPNPIEPVKDKLGDVKEKKEVPELGLWDMITQNVLITQIKGWTIYTYS